MRRWPRRRPQDRAVGWDRARAEIAKVPRHARQLRPGRGGCPDLAARGRPGSAGALPRPDRRRDGGPPARRVAARGAAARRRSDHQREAGERAPPPRRRRLRPGRHGDRARRHFTVRPRRAGAVRDGLPGPGEALEPVRRGGRHRRHAPGRDRQLPGDDRLGPLPVSAARGRAPPRPCRRGRGLRHVFAKLADREPANLEARWLLNLSAMLLGRHPEGVPGAAPAPRPISSVEGAGAALHRRRAPWSACGTNSTAGGTIVDDFDGDGLLDIVVSSVGPLRARCASTATRATARSRIAPSARGLARPARRPQRSSQADYDNDGWLDIFVHARRLGVSRCATRCCATTATARFTDVTAAAGLPTAPTRTQTAAWADFDNDGWLDLFVGHELSPSAALPQPAATARSRTSRARAGVARTAFTKGVAVGRLRQRRLRRTSTSRTMSGDNFLYHNKRRRHVRPRSARALGVQQPLASFPTWFFDYDNDGWLDLFVVALPDLGRGGRQALPAACRRTAETLKLYRNNGRRRLRRRDARRSGSTRVVPAMGANFGDIDNDGFLDIYLGTGAPSYARADARTSCCATTAGGASSTSPTATGTGHLQKGHGVAFADLDNDGDQDIVLERRRRGARRPLRRRALREPRARGPALDRRPAGRRHDRTARRSARRSGSRRGGRGAGRPAACATARCRAAARSARTATSSTSASAAPRPSKSIEIDLAGEQDAPGVPEPADRHAARDPRGRRRTGGPTTAAVPPRSSRRRAPPHQH